MAFADLQHGRVIYHLEVEGIGVFSTDDIDLSEESWYSGEGYASLGARGSWLVYESIGNIGETIDFSTGNIKVSNLSLVLSDRDGQVTALCKDLGQWTYTYLTQTLTESEEDYIYVEDTTDFPSAGKLYIGNETISYTSKGSSTRFDGLTRNRLGSESAEHYVNMTPADGIPIQPSVAAGPQSFSWRRAILRASVLAEPSGTPEESVVIYRGRITKGARVGRGRYELTIEHISAVLFDKVGTELPQTTIKRCYWYNGRSASDVGGELALGWVREVWTADTPLEVVTVIPKGLYWAGELSIAWNATIAVTGTAFQLGGGAGSRYTLNVATNSTYTREIWIRKGDPLWALGFDVAHHLIPKDADDWTYEAENDPRWLVVDLSQRLTGGFSSDPEVAVRNADDFAVDAYAVVPGNSYCILETVSTNLVSLRGESLDTIVPVQPWWIVEEEDDATLQQCIAIDTTIPNALKQLLHLATSQVEPDRWCATGIRSEDIDWDELDSALGSVSPVLNTVETAVTEAREVWEIIGTHLALFGICPRITTNGKIGFARIRTPLTSDANAVELDSAVWAAREAAGVEARVDEDPTVGEVVVKYRWDYRKEAEGWPRDLKFPWREGSRSLGKSRSLTYEVPGLSAPSYTLEELQSALRNILIATHFSILGRQTSNVEIPCVWGSRQLLCGDVVLITHDVAPDTVEGSIGVADRLGIVVGKKHKLGDIGTDTIIVKLGPAANGAGIAPAVLITSDNGDDIGTVASTTVFSADDMDYFAVGQDVILIEYDTTSATATAATIDFISGSNITFSASIFDAGQPTPCLMIPASWDDAASAHQAYAYTADFAATPTLGTAADPMKVWVP